MQCQLLELSSYNAIFTYASLIPDDVLWKSCLTLIICADFTCYISCIPSTDFLADPHLLTHLLFSFHNTEWTATVAGTERPAETNASTASFIRHFNLCQSLTDLFVASVVTRNHFFKSFLHGFLYSGNLTQTKPEGWLGWLVDCHTNLLIVVSDSVLKLTRAPNGSHGICIWGFLASLIQTR